MEKELCEDVTCPTCSSPMYRIHGKYGEFYGCSKFPKCTGKKSSYAVNVEFGNWDEDANLGIAGLADWRDQF